MVDIDSGDVGTMRDEPFGDLLDEINAKQRQVRMTTILVGLACAFGLASVFVAGAVGAAGFLFILPAWGIGLWLDSFRRTTVLFYEFDDAVERAYKGVTYAFDTLMDCEGKWHIEAGGAIDDLTTRKRHAGATHLVRKKTTTLSFDLPKVIKSNLTPPALHVGRQIIYFFPDVALIEDGKRIGAVGYKELNVTWQEANFVEQGKVPRDARVVGHTWRYPNKSGGPDKRFKENYEIPICLYEEMHLESDSGVDELVEFSHTGVVEPFALALSSLPNKAATPMPLAREALLKDVAARISALGLPSPALGSQRP